MTLPLGPVDALAARIRACRICRDRPRYGAALPHQPRPLLQLSATARICIASQAPGVRAHGSGIPFNDPSGARLRAWMGIGAAEFYDAANIAIVPMGFCFPGVNAQGSDLPPRRECAGTWHEQLFRLLPNLGLLLLIGQHAQRFHLGKAAAGKRLDELMRDWRQIYAPEHSPDAMPGGGPRTLPLPHPSWRNSGWLKRNPWFEAELLPVLRADIRRLIG